jgi:hypothetical protein
MNAAVFFILFSALFFSIPSCKEVKKTPDPAGVNVMIHDISCEEVIQRVLKECHRQGLPFEWADKGQGLLSIGPVTTTPLSSADPFIKMEEKIDLEIKCPAPLSTRIAVQLQLKGLTSKNRWSEIKDPEKLNAYGKRFLDRLVMN